MTAKPLRSIAALALLGALGCDPAPPPSPVAVTGCMSCPPQTVCQESNDPDTDTVLCIPVDNLLAEGSDTLSGQSHDAGGEMEESGSHCADFGCSCAENTDCATGLCLEASEGGICTMYCSQSCPDDWICTESSLGPSSVCHPNES